VLDRVAAAGDGGTSAVTAQQARQIAEVMRNNLRITPGFAPGVYDGDVLFFSAAADAAAEPGAPADPSVAPGKADAWRPYVAGTLHDHPLSCGHYDMTEPGPMAEIGGALAAALGACPLPGPVPASQPAARPA
jgi:thioesterase domain-containing protein